ncbi:MAG: hypothetical protein ACE5JJ_08935 [Nitrospinota bacterium]
MSEQQVRLEGGRLLEAVAGAEGREWEVVLIRTGLSANGNFYPEEVLRRSLPLFEGVRAFADHGGGPERSVRDLVGWFSGARLEGGRVLARFHLVESAEWLRSLLLDAHRRGRPDLVGFSIDAAVRAGRRMGPEGPRTEVEEILRVFSVDVVTEPAAGGAVLRLVASRGEGPKALAEVLIEEEAMKEQGHETNGTGPEMGHPDAQARWGPQMGAPPADGERDALLREAKEAASRLILEAELAEAHLPSPLERAVRERFAGRPAGDRAEVRGAVQEARELWAALAQPGALRERTGVEVVRDEADRHALALDGFFAGEDLEGVARFRNLREAHRVMTGRPVEDAGQLLRESHPDYWRAGVRVRESLQGSSWAEALGDSIRRRVVAEYNLPQFRDWRKAVSSVVPVMDFRTQRRVRVGGYGSLPSAPEGANYTKLTSPTDEEVTYSLAKYGGTEDLTLEMVANDDVGAIRRIPRALGLSAAIGVYRFVFDIFKDNPTYEPDGLALFHASHNNLDSSALSATSLSSARFAMRSQTAYGSAITDLGAMNLPFNLIVPSELEETAFKLATSAVFVASGEGATTPNIHQGLQVVVVDYWADANDWCLTANPRFIPTIEVGFYQGREEPELFVQDLPNVGSLFDADKITYKIRHIYSGKVLDYRGLYKSAVV